MKFLKQVALVTAVAAASGSAFALEALDDKALAEKTGQDGLAITISPSDSGIKIAQVLVHDNDGLKNDDAKFSYKATDDTDLNGAATEGVAGALVIGDSDKTTPGLKIQGGDITVNVDTDGGTATDGSDAFINAAVNMSGKTKINIEGIYVGKSGTAADDPDNAGQKLPYTGKNQRGAAVGSKGKILGNLGLEITDAKMNVQLGKQHQGAMVLMNAKLTNGLKLTGLEVIDGDGGPAFTEADGTTPGTPKTGGLYVGEITLTDDGSTDMTLLNKVDIDGDRGIVITMDSPDSGYYGYMKSVGISNGAGTLNKTIGDVELVGLNLGSSTISINGK